MSRVLTNVRWLATCPASGGPDDLGLIENAALAWSGGSVCWVGPVAELPAEYAHWEQVNAQGCGVIPGLIDCHTHLAFAGWRADEFAERCRGRTYQEIAARGGGIVKTVRQTRAATEGDLFSRAKHFWSEMVALGVTIAECKSGYGLTTADELKLLRVYRLLREEEACHLVPTFLGAHAIPPEFQGDRAGYVRLVCDEMIPQVAAQKLARFCDVFVEEGAFTRDEARHVFAAAKAHGLTPKLHADQFSDAGGATLAAEVGAASADHLELASDTGLQAMAEAGVVAVLLPFATLNTHVPPLDARRCRRAGVTVAVATDFNPGSAPCYHLPLALSLACSLNRLTPAQALRAGTIHAARALRLHEQHGSLEVGKSANFVLLEDESVAQWLYHFRPNATRAVYHRGVQLL